MPDHDVMNLTSSRLHDRLRGYSESISRHPASLFIGTSFVFLVIFLYLLLRMDYPLVYDSEIYWHLADSFNSSGGFSFLNFSVQLRGYLFPALLFLVKWLAGVFGLDARLGFVICSALFFALFTMIILPWFFKIFLGWTPGLWQRFIPALLFFYFWRGYFIYPLTDFPALVFFMIGAAMLLRIFENQAGNPWSILVGAFFAAAVNIRPVYQIAVIFTAILFLLAGRRLGIWKLILCFLLFLFGFGLILVPQSLINQKYFDSSSPFVLAKYDADVSLYVNQLFMGLKYQKAFANVGETYPNDVVSYREPVFEILPRESTRQRSLPAYAGIVRQHPLDMAVLYFRHLFNGIDIFFPTPYVSDPRETLVGFSFLNYLVWFLVLYRVFRSRFERLSLMQFWGFVCVISPALVAIPTEVEVRFFLPMFVCVYGTAGYGIDYGSMFASLKNNRVQFLRVILLGFLWLMVCFTLSLGTRAQLVAG